MECQCWSFSYCLWLVPSSHGIRVWGEKPWQAEWGRGSARTAGRIAGLNFLLLRITLLGVSAAVVMDQIGEASVVLEFAKDRPSFVSIDNLSAAAFCNGLSGYPAVCLGSSALFLVTTVSSFLLRYFYPRQYKEYLLVCQQRWWWMLSVYVNRKNEILRLMGTFTARFSGQLV